jgi:hypothetical protein
MNEARGGCLCGAIRYQVTGAPSSSIICHCRTCRKASGAPSVGWLTFDRAHFTVLAGLPRCFVSSPGVERTFCATCGTPLTYANEKTPEEIDVTTVSLDEEMVFAPASEVWVSHQLDWETVDPERTQYPEGTREGTAGPKD